MVRFLSVAYIITILLACGGNGSELFAQDDTEYSGMISKWKSVEDINEWIGKNFTYDMNKALRVSRSGGLKNRSAQILAPDEFVAQKTGICVDLARFGYESLSIVALELNPKYLMIEFVPIEKDGSVLRLHWIALFQKGGKYYTFADSNRPGVISGPYENVGSLVAAYETFRGRKVVGYKLLDSYQKSKKKKRSKQVK